MPELNLPKLPSSSTGKYLKDDGTWGTPGGGPGAVDWGDIGGTLSDQTDLVTALSDNLSDANDYADTLASALDSAKLDVPTGTPDGTKYLRDDNTWQAVSGGSGLAQYQVRRILRR